MDESFEFQAGVQYATELMDKYSHVDPAPYDSYLPIPQKHLDVLWEQGVHVPDVDEFWKGFDSLTIK